MDVGAAGEPAAAPLAQPLRKRLCVELDPLPTDRYARMPLAVVCRRRPL